MTVTSLTPSGHHLSGYKGREEAIKGVGGYHLSEKEAKGNGLLEVGGDMKREWSP